jgi:hypothetical protein
MRIPVQTAWPPLAANTPEKRGSPGSAGHLFGHLQRVESIDPQVRQAFQEAVHVAVVVVVGHGAVPVRAVRMRWREVMAMVSPLGKVGAGQRCRFGGVWVRYIRGWPEPIATPATTLEPDDAPRMWPDYEQREADMRFETVLRSYPLDWFQREV